MRVFLQQRPDAGEAPRYVQLTLQPDLFGGWELLRETGQIGGHLGPSPRLFSAPDRRGSSDANRH